MSPKGPSSGMRMLTFFINRAGKNLSKKRRGELEKAKVLLSERVHAARADQLQALQREPKNTASHAALSRQAKSAARRRRSAPTRKAA
ncbi:MAG: DUF3175 domain-containing protein [Terracidiphilus sp.]